jgi:hypothetical protein
MSRKKLVVPTIHLNGSSPDRLMEVIREAAGGVDDARRKLQECAPHGRDYYVQQDPEALTKATEQHLARMAKLDGVYDDLAALYEAIQAQVDEREQRRSGGR